MDLGEIRAKIDKVDDTILEAFLERMSLSDEVAKYKKENSMGILNKTREREILAKVSDKSGDMERYSYHLFSTMFGLSRARQEELLSGESKVKAVIDRGIKNGGEVFPQTGMIACQGVEGANSQEACDKLFPRGKLMYLKSFEAVFDAVGSGLCKYGVVPIENSANGSVRAVYDLLQKKNFSIVRSIRLFIHHELMVKPGAKMSDIKEIYSHEQALGQCSEFLSKLGPGVKVIACDNTAMAAELVAKSEGNHRAAISSHRCAQLYGLETINSRIQNSENNYTRFICIANKPEIYAGANHISLVLACDNRPGALYEILARLSVAGVNMSKLESCPVTGSNFEFIFFLELDASVREPGVLAMLEELERNCESFTFLGNYAEV